MVNNILIHAADDDVGVAVADLKAGQEIGVVTLEGQPVKAVKLVTDVPLGHKVAMTALPANKHIIEYGRAIGYALVEIKAGEHVHVHNIRSLRWAGAKLTIDK
jgi:(2R)-sulfolactate sulfo-lyase subunit alpha